MPKGLNQKFKLYRLAEIMLKQTDDNHYLTMPEIIAALNANEVTADRKSIYNDLRDLEQFGIVIEGEAVGKSYRYHVVRRPFELAELKLLIDAIQSSKFITEKKSNQLIKKLEGLVSKYEAQQLQHQVFVAGRVKTMNESIYYAVDGIHRAISANRQIRFQYWQWNVKKEAEFRHDGQWYHISPWGLCWDDENYYMIGYDAQNNGIRHYRVDKMKNIRTEEAAREGRELFQKQNLAEYGKKTFGMFGGEEVKVSLRAENGLVGVIIDRFGKDVIIVPDGEDHFQVNVDVQVSNQFLGWIISLGEGIEITGPAAVVDQMKEQVLRLNKQYLET